ILQQMGEETANFPDKTMVGGGLRCFFFVYRHHHPDRDQRGTEDPFWRGIVERWNTKLEKLEKKGITIDTQNKYGRAKKCDLLCRILLPNGKVLFLWIEA